MKVEKVDSRILARIDEPSRIFEVNFDEVRINDVTITFHREGNRVGSIYNDDGTERLMARLNTVGKEDFISTQIEREFVESILTKAEKHGMLQEGSSSLDAYKIRMDIGNDQE